MVSLVFLSSNTFDFKVNNNLKKAKGISVTEIGIKYIIY